MTALVDEARLLPQADARAEDLWQRALALYRGPLLSGLDSAWVTVHRTMLQEYHIEALLGAGRCAQSRQSYQEAIDYINTALIVDPFREEAYRTLFKCYATLGEYRQVAFQFHEMQALFENELGITPSPETMSLMQQLLYS
jgi:DNA-binding SARP family transcriptional activator